MGDEDENIEDTSIPQVSTVGEGDETSLGLLNPNDQSSLFADAPHKAKVQIDPNLTINDISVGSQLSTSLPYTPADTKPYVPVLYTFRMRSQTLKTIKRGTCKPPPFYIMLDHTIAVIWSLFSNSGQLTKLGINQLQWAMYFLRAIKNPDGTYPKDIKLGIDAIQDLLIDEYADLSRENVMYGDACFGDFVAPGSRPEFSFNYTVISDAYNNSGLSSTDGGKEESQEFMEEMANIKALVGIDDMDVSDAVSKDKTLDILSEWKREQIDKISTEVKMLQTVEDMMKNVDEEKFEGYTDQSTFESLFSSRSDPNSSSPQQSDE